MVAGAAAALLLLLTGAALLAPLPQPFPQQALPFAGHAAPRERLAPLAGDVPRLALPPPLQPAVSAHPLLLLLLLLLGLVAAGSSVAGAAT